MEFLVPFAEYYYFVYWFVVLLMTVKQFNSISKYPRYGVIKRSFDYHPLLMFSVFFTFIFGLRPVHGVAAYFGDTGHYAGKYERYQNFGIFKADGSNDLGSDWLFDVIEKVCAEIMDVHLWLLLLMCLFIVPTFMGCKQIDRKHGALLMLFCIGSFIFYSSAVNGIRNGIALSIEIMAVAVLCKKKSVLAAILCFIAVGFHKSALLPTVAMFITYFVKNPKYMFLTWIGAIVVSLVLGGQIDNILSAISYDERLAYNLKGDGIGDMGEIMERRFRWDFLLYSSMPILLAWYTIFKRKLYDNTYLILLGTYMYANSFWVLAIRTFFSNRIANLSWFLFPIILAYPLLNFPVFKKNHNKKTAWILLAHFGFTSLYELLR